MTDERRRIVDRYVKRSGTPSEPVPESSDDYQAAGPVSGNRPPEIMLELRVKSGDSLALGYAYLLSAEWNRSEGIILEFTTHTIRLAGRNLREVYRAIVAHRLPYVRELSTRDDEEPDDSAVVTSIGITKL